LKKPQDFLSLGAVLLLPLAAGGLGAVATNSSVSTWYRGLKKPPWNPPVWVFGLRWIGLAMADLVALWGTLLTCLIKFRRVRPLAGC